jgi:hypothetical protein
VRCHDLGGIAICYRHDRFYSLFTIDEHIAISFCNLFVLLYRNYWSVLLPAAVNAVGANAALLERA